MLTQQLIESCVPKNFTVSLEGKTRQTNLISTQFSVGIPLGEIGFVIRQNGYGTVFIQDRWRIENCNHVRRVAKIENLTTEKLKEEIVREINRQMKEIT